MAEDHDEDHSEDRPDYDPASKDLPSREPPLRSTAPQSGYTNRDVGLGFAVFLVGTVLTFGLPLALVVP